MSDWVASFILPYEDERFFKWNSDATVQMLFSDWLNEQFGLRNFSQPASWDRWQIYGTSNGEANGVKVVFKRKEDAMMFKLAWL